MMLMQTKNTERLSLTLQRATFLGSANVRPTPQMKDKKNMVLLHASEAVPTNPKPEPTTPTTVACSIERDPPRPKRIPRPSPELVTIDSLSG